MKCSSQGRRQTGSFSWIRGKSWRKADRKTSSGARRLSGQDSLYRKCTFNMRADMKKRTIMLLGLITMAAVCTACGKNGEKNSRAKTRTLQETRDSKEI